MTRCPYCGPYADGAEGGCIAAGVDSDRSPPALTFAGQQVVGQFDAATYAFAEVGDGE